MVVSLRTVASTLPEIFASQGQLILTQFVSAPFPHPQRAEGREYHGQLFSARNHYADSTVAIFIPQGFHETGRIDFVIHFHGWRNHRHGRLVDLYTEHGGTREETERLMGILKQREVPFFAGKEPEVTAIQLRQTQPIFLYTELAHDKVMQGNRAFRRLLESSSLEGL